MKTKNIIEKTLEKFGVEKELPGRGDLSEKEKLIPLEGGGSAKFIKFSDYKDPAKKVKDIDLASLFTPGKTLASLTDAERDQVNLLLKLTLGSKD